MSALSYADVSLSYRAGAPEAIRAVSVEIEAGSITWLFGALGAGCSSFLLAAGGLAPRHTGGTMSGAVRALGADPHTLAGRRALSGRLAYVTASPAVQLSGVAGTVWEEVAFAPANLGWPIERIRTAVDGALSQLGIGHLRDRAPDALSGGETQRVVLAGMLVLAPDLWLLDEPGSALDRSGREQLSIMLRREAARGAAVVVASEDADTMLGLADRVLVLNGGAIVLDGDPRALLAGEEIWGHVGASTSIATLARDAARLETDVPTLLRPPYPLTFEEGILRWT